MTRASLLHILDHVGGISETEIRELEQLAAAFPYCQTAHLLLAKADHDRGSMLASQRLRRAATYAADRQLLRHLLEQPVQERLAAPAPQHLVGTAAAPQAAPAQPAGNTAAFLQTLEPEDVLPLDNTLEDTDGSSATLVEEEAPTPLAATIPAETVAPLAPAAAAASADTTVAADAVEPTETTSTEAAVSLEQVEHIEAVGNEAAVASDTAVYPETAGAEASAATGAAPEPAVPAASEMDAPAETAASTDEAATLDASEETEPAAAPNETDSPAATASAEPTVAAEEAPAASSPEATTEPVPAEEELLPPVAPPIRPPAEAGISRFEFGLAVPDALPAPSSYQLTGADSDDDLALLLPPAPKPVVPAFHSDAALAYALMGGGSRLGYALQMQDGELTTGLPTDEFFAPDALLQAHAAAHQPKRRPARSSLALIDQFLQNQPRLKSAAKRPAPAEEQDDLSVRSTSVVPQLASESLAKIMVKQGKIDKAIEIYERLIVRQPEKSAYFTDQIHQLQTPE
ncbi:hypothetical protein [Hymenobacter yonginensis]|uniref:Tetratricopeptide repeat protein n=1 Tax=Hymenobacter yonginensis TaxID=748197 RepID=A0ABY7PTY1_9BACT|nr:hypothetical protein [Hymenobacter yonginensis]WBO86309.1 hypothetical protein O9Z63_08600 [Hymenobacter yonginensis]